MLLENKKTHLAFVSLMRLQNKAKNFKEKQQKDDSR